MKIKRYGMNVRETELQPREKQKGNYKSRVLHKAFNKGGIPLFVKTSKSFLLKKMVCTYNNTALILILSKMYMLQLNTKANL